MTLKIVLLASMLLAARAAEANPSHELSCTGRVHHNVTLTAYYPDFSSETESDYLDLKGKKMRSLQEFLDDRAAYVTVSMDKMPKIKYGTVLCSPELNQHFGRRVPLQVRDHGANLKGKGYSRLDICVRTEADSYDNAVNRVVTVYNENE